VWTVTSYLGRGCVGLRWVRLEERARVPWLQGKTNPFQPEFSRWIGFRVTFGRCFSGKSRDLHSRGL